MDRDSILKAAQANTTAGKEHETREGIRSSLIGILVALAVIAMQLIVKYIHYKTVDVGLVGIVFSASGVQMLYEGIKVKSALKIVIGAIQIIIALFCIVGFFGQVTA